MGLSIDRVLSEYNEDSAHTSADIGQFVLAVVQDSLASSAADGDYAAIKANLKGELYSHDVDAVALLGTIDADTGGILADTTAILADTTAILADTTAIAASVASIDGDTTNILADTTAILADTTAILVDTGVIAGDTTSIDAILTALSKAEDSVHGDGEQGIISLGVRSDSGNPLAANGEYIPFTMNSGGRLRVESEKAVPNTAIAAAAVPVGVTEVKLPTAPLALRDSVIIQNLGSVPLYVGPAGVAIGSGLEISKRSSLEVALGPGVDIYGITSIAAQDVRVFETA